MDDEVKSLLEERPDHPGEVGGPRAFGHRGDDVESSLSIHSGPPIKLGIGANIALADATLLRPLLFPDADRLVGEVVRSGSEPDAHCEDRLGRLRK